MKIASFLTSALMVAVGLLYWLFPPTSLTNFSDAALGQETQTVLGIHGGDRVHCFDMSHAEECLIPARERELNRSVLWLGNSQLHAINQTAPGDQPASASATEDLRVFGIELLTFSQPNANLAEHLILFNALSQAYPFDMLVLPVVFDDTREQAIRPSIKSLLVDESIAAQLSTSEVGRELLTDVPFVQDEGSNSLQSWSETSITSALESCCRLEALRAKARGETSLFLYRLRNYAFGINPSSIRRLIPAIYARNMAALIATLQSARDKGVAVILYIPPLRSDTTPPYDPIEYATFVAEVRAIATEHGAHFESFEDLIPGPLWGTKDSTSIGGGPEFDFMHFQGAGHDLLARQVAQSVLNAFDDF